MFSEKVCSTKVKSNQKYLQMSKSNKINNFQLENNIEMEILDCKIMEVSRHISEKLGLQIGQKAMYIHSKKIENGEATAMIKTFLSCDRCEFVMGRISEYGSIHSILAENPDTEILKIERTIEAMNATAYDICNLKVNLEDAIQQYISVGYNRDEEVIEYSVIRHRGNKNRFNIRMMVQ